MSKRDDLLEFFLNNIGQWTCAYCGCGSNQSAAIFREVKKMGYRFEEISPNQWGKQMYCDVCGTKRTHYKLLSSEPEFREKQRGHIDAESRKRILKLLQGRDAFTGATITSTPEIDHKTPWTRLEVDYDVRNMTDEEICDAFQLLTREHNLLKDRMCDKCRITGIRPPFFGISFWYKGDQSYCDTCEGCGWHDGVKWREAVDDKLAKE